MKDELRTENRELKTVLGSGWGIAAWDLDGFAAAFAGADADAIFEREDEDFSVADFAAGSGASAFHEGVDGGFEEFFIHGDHELDFAQEVDGEFVAAIGLGMAALASEALDVHDSEAEDFDVGQCGLDGFEAMGLDDGDNEFHGYESLPRGIGSVLGLLMIA